MRAWSLVVCDLLIPFKLTMQRFLHRYMQSTQVCFCSLYLVLWWRQLSIVYYIKYIFQINNFFLYIIKTHSFSKSESFFIREIVFLLSYFFYSPRKNHYKEKCYKFQSWKCDICEQTPIDNITWRINIACCIPWKIDKLDCIVIRS